MDDMTKQDIEKYLNEVNKKLAERGKHGEIVMAGGASLTVVYNARNATHDIDALFRPSKEFREIISEIANENDLKDDWLNDGVKGFFTEKMNANLYKEYSNLSVYSIDAEGLLALKLTSARLDSKDMRDSITLMKCLDIKNEEQLFNIIEKYTSPNQQTAKCHYFTLEAFNQYMMQKEREKVKTGVSDEKMNMDDWKKRITQKRESNNAGNAELPKERKNVRHHEDRK